MVQKRSPPNYGQYGLKDEDAQTVDACGNRPGGEAPVIGPADRVDASGHRLAPGHDETSPAEQELVDEQRARDRNDAANAGPRAGGTTAR
ncbi:hypothetical protein [Acidovorax sp. M2(2025)]|uniref:hypothetical protein n=1 Tax=Acidovorax sp. M2(2025) TaxID=3411355 RepID=UPI003BF59A2A